MIARSSEPSFVCSWKDGPDGGWWARPWNGRHAVDTFHEHMPHVTVMDFVMPEMDGLEAARQLIRRYPSVIILIVTADPLRQLIEDAKTAGVKGLCPKSKPDCLLKAIETLIAGGTHFHQESAVA